MFDGISITSLLWEIPTMNPASRPPQSLIARVAAMRASGQSWEGIANQMNCPVLSIRLWPVYYPFEWRRAFDESMARIVAEASEEAWQTFRRLMRSTDEGVALAAAGAAIKHRLKYRAAGLG
jgi:hypothetical protein